jgi:hypothetical protein
MDDDVKVILTGTVGDADAAPATGIRVNERGQVDAAIEFNGTRTQLAQGLDAIYDLLEQGLAETRGRLVGLQEEVDGLQDRLPLPCRYGERLMPPVVPQGVQGVLLPSEITMLLEGLGAAPGHPIWDAIARYAVQSARDGCAG